MKTNRTTTVRQLTAQAWTRAWLIITLIAIAAVPAAAGGAGTNAPQVQLVTTTGNTAVASFEHYDASGLIYTSVFIEASRGKEVTRTIGPCGESILTCQNAAISISQTDLGHGVMLLDAFGLTDRIEYRLNPALRSASLAVRILAFDAVNLLDLNLDVRLNWAAVGERVHEENTTRQTESGSLVIDHLDASHRLATASGSIVGIVAAPWWAGGTNFTEQPSIYGQLDSAVVETLTITPAPRMH